MRRKVLVLLSLMGLSAFGGAYLTYCIMEETRISRSKNKQKSEPFYEEEDLEMLDPDIDAEE